MLFTHFLVNLVQYLIQVVIQMSLLSQLLVTSRAEVSELLLRQVVCLLELFFQALADLHESHFVTR